ncbi:Ku protein [Streptomyces bauhiniae]|uniref:non-homologous end joining protein Ku n=1 Tax=Streptomyces bauhiniae TaxID=2340725 RepID=UPI003319786E
MPRSIWSGAVSFGLVTVPIHVVGATTDHSVHFRQIHREDGGRIRNRKICELDGHEVPDSEIGRAFEVSKDHVIPLTDQELRNLPLPTAKALEIRAFVPLASIDPIRISAGYYLQPDGPVAAKPYRLLVEALGRSARVAIAKFAWSGRERLGILRVRDGVLVLHGLHWPDEIRNPATLAPSPATVTEGEIESAVALMAEMTVEDLTGPDFTDRYTEALEKVLEAKQRELPPPEPPEPERAPGRVLDLMAALNASVDQAKKSRSGGVSQARRGTPAKNTPAAAGKKTTPRKRSGSRRA